MFTLDGIGHFLKATLSMLWVLLDLDVLVVQIVCYGTAYLICSVVISFNKGHLEIT